MLRTPEPPGSAPSCGGRVTRKLKEAELPERNIGMHALRGHVRSLLHGSPEPVGIARQQLTKEPQSVPAARNAPHEQQALDRCARRDGAIQQLSQWVQQRQVNPGAEWCAKFRDVAGRQ